MENNNSSNKITLLMILMSLFFAFQIFSFFQNKGDLPKIDYIKNEISNLKDDVKGIYKTENAMNQKIDTFNSGIKRINDAVNTNNIKIDNLKKNEKIQIDNFKSYDARMWEQYFADRYAKVPTTPAIK